MLQLIREKKFALGDESMCEKTTLKELITITQDFISLADKLLVLGKITTQEYNELTYVKKDFLAKMESEI